MKINLRLLRLAVALLSAVSFATLASTGAASAATALKPSAPVFEFGGPAPAGAVFVSMTLVTPKEAADHIAPDNTVHGNCGSAWFGLANLEAGQARASYGFEIDYPGASASAFAVVSGAHVTKTHTDPLTPLYGGKDWDSGFTATIGDGPAFGTVEMVAVLTNGDTCESLDPTGTTVVT